MAHEWMKAGLLGSVAALGGTVYDVTVEGPMLRFAREQGWLPPPSVQTAPAPERSAQTTPSVASVSPAPAPTAEEAQRNLR